MKGRCSNPNTKFYSYYGGRGIKVCDRWMDFSKFVADMGEKPSPTHSIDRIDSDADYSPQNCRWSTKREQVLNTRLRVDNTSGHKGVSWDNHVSKWRAYADKLGKRIYIGIYADLSEAINAREHYDANSIR